MKIISVYDLPRWSSNSHRWFLVCEVLNDGVHSDEIFYFETYEDSVNFLDEVDNKGEVAIIEPDTSDCS